MIEIAQDALLHAIDDPFLQTGAENVVVDGRLVTGQNPASAKKAARSIIEMLQINEVR